MDRRRFLKYAGAGVALAGSALTGYEYDRWQSSTVATSVSTRTVTETKTLRETTTETVKLASLQGRLFFDYNGNGVQDGEEPAVSAIIRLEDNNGKVIASTVSDSAGDYKLKDIPSGSYRVYVGGERKYRYMCRSVEEFRELAKGYDVLLDEDRKMDIQ